MGSRGRRTAPTNPQYLARNVITPTDPAGQEIFTKKPFTVEFESTDPGGHSIGASADAKLQAES